MMSKPTQVSHISTAQSSNVSMEGSLGEPSTSTAFLLNQEENIFEFERSKRRIVHNFFIIDLLQAQYLHEEKIFKVYNTRFLNIAIMGYIIECKPFQDSMILKIDDGTSFIEVFIEQEYLEIVERFRMPFNSSLYSERESNFPKDDIDLVVKAMKNSTINIKPIDEFITGDVVLIRGKLSEWEGKRRIFSKSIRFIPEKDSLDALNEWRLDRINFYGEI